MPTLLALDSETHIIAPGLLTPPGVCGSFSDGIDSWIETFSDYLETFEGALHPGCTLTGANIAYDFGVAVAPVKGGRFTGRPELLKAIFEKYTRGEVFDILIAMSLDQVAGGNLFKDPVTGGPLRMPADPVTGKAGKSMYRYSLALTHYMLTGRLDAKANSQYVLRYHEFENMPIAEWPIEAQTYPVDDARNTYECAAILQEKGRNLGKLERHPWTHQTHQARAAWCLHLASAWGLRTDPERVEALALRVETEHAKTIETFRASGLVLPDGKDNTREIKRRVIAAYGDPSAGACDNCKGTGRATSEVSGNEINCKKCSATGLEVSATVPLTPAGGVKADRDTLSESGDELLETWADAGESTKIRETYLPFLRQGTERPINVRGNVLVETGRASFEGLIQLLPRKGGVRECFKARPAMSYCSVDYSAQELGTLAQVNLWVTGFSYMAEAINAGKDLHSILGAQMVGRTYEEFKAEVKNKNPTYTNYRHAAKAGNFGFGGLMGAAKFALTQRKAKSFPNPDGTKHGSMCRLGGCEVEPCGTHRITEWKGRECPPVCEACVDFSSQLKDAWLKAWPEMVKYFNWIKSIPGVSDGHGVMTSPGTGYVRGGLNASAAANHPFQHLAAMMTKHALWLVSKEAYTDEASPLFGSRPVAFLHDELFAEVPEALQHEAGYRMRDVMTREAAPEFCPDVKFEAEPALCKYWHKEMGTVHENGKLICWEPGMVVKDGNLISRAAST